MSLENRIYSVLLVSASDTFNTAVYDMLPESKYSPVKTVKSINAAKRACAEKSFDFIIVNSPLPDGAGTRLAVDICSTSGTVVLFMAGAELYGELNSELSRQGVFTLIKPTSKPMLLTALGWMASTRERLKKSEKKTLSIEEKMEEIRLVNRAKWLLIGEIKMDEQKAHRYIEKLAMDRCVSKREIAEEIIKTYT